MEFPFIESSSFFVDLCSSLSDARVVAARRALAGRSVEITAAPIMQLVDQSNLDAPRVKPVPGPVGWWVLSWAKQ